MKLPDRFRLNHLMVKPGRAGSGYNESTARAALQNLHRDQANILISTRVAMIIAEHRQMDGVVADTRRGKLVLAATTSSGKGPTGHIDALMIVDGHGQRDGVWTDVAIASWVRHEWGHEVRASVKRALVDTAMRNAAEWVGADDCLYVSPSTAVTDLDRLPGHPAYITTFGCFGDIARVESSGVSEVLIPDLVALTAARYAGGYQLG